MWSKVPRKVHYAPIEEFRMKFIVYPCNFLLSWSERKVPGFVEVQGDHRDIAKCHSAAKIYWLSHFSILLIFFKSPRQVLCKIIFLPLVQTDFFDGVDSNIYWKKFCQCILVPFSFQIHWQNVFIQTFTKLLSHNWKPILFLQPRKQNV